MWVFRMLIRQPRFAETIDVMIKVLIVDVRHPLDRRYCAAGLGSQEIDERPSRLFVTAQMS